MSTMPIAHSRGPELGHFRPPLLTELLFGPDRCGDGSSVRASSKTADLSVFPPVGVEPVGGGVAAPSGAVVVSVFSSQQLREVFARFRSGSAGGQPNLSRSSGRGVSTSAEVERVIANGEGAEPDLLNASCAPTGLRPVKSRRRPTLWPLPFSRTVFGIEAVSVFSVVLNESCLGKTYGNFFWRSAASESAGTGRGFRGCVFVVGVATRATACPSSLLPFICRNFAFCLARNLPRGGVGLGGKADPETLIFVADLHLVAAVSPSFSCRLAGPPVPDNDRRRAVSVSTDVQQNMRDAHYGEPWRRLWLHMYKNLRSFP